MSAPTVQPLFAKTILARTITAYYIRPQPFGISDGDQFDPRLLFTKNEQGGWYDPSDFSSMYQDSAGTTPVTALGQPVGLMLDKRLGLPLGPNIVTNGTFSNGTTGWTNNGGFATTFAAGSHDGKATALHVITPSNSGGAVQSPMTAGKVYSVTYDIKVITGAVYVGIGVNTVGGVHTTTDAANWRTVTRSVYVASDAAIRVYSSTTNTDFWITNISVRELPGNHATQSTAGNRPTVEARVNRLVNTRFIGGGAAPTNYAQPFGTGTSAPSGTASNGDTIYTQTATAQRPLFASSASFSIEAGVTQVVSMEITAVSGLLAADVLRFSAIPAGSTVSWPICSANPSGGASGALTTGTLAMVISAGATAGSAQIYFGAGCLGNVTGSISFHSPQLEYGIAPTVYQRVTTATDYADIGAPRYLQFDGATSNRWLQTASINFTSTDKMTVWVGVRKESDAAAGVVAELSASIASNNGAFAILAPASAAANAQYASKGTTQSSGTATTVAAPTTFVIAGASSIASPSVSTRINGISGASNTFSQGTGNYGNYPLYIGRRGGSSLPFNGRLYGLIVRGAASNAGQIAAAEAWMNSKTRAY